MKNQAVFSSKDTSKKLKCHLLQFLFGTLRVKNKYGTMLILLNTLRVLHFAKGRHYIMLLLLYCCFTSTVNI